MKKEEEFIKYIIENKIKPFYKTFLPGLYDDSLNVIVDFQENTAVDDLKIGADKNSEYIHFHIGDNIPDGSIEQIAKQKISFQDIIDSKSVECTEKIEREEAYTVLLVHEFGHKYFWNMMQKNSSYMELKDFRENHYFNTVDIVKKIGKQVGLYNPLEIKDYLMNTNFEDIPDVLKDDVKMILDKKNGKSELDIALGTYERDKTHQLDIDEFLSKSIERIYIENSNLSLEQKNALLNFREDFFRNHPYIETSDKESKQSKVYQDEVFYRLYNGVGEKNFTELLKNANYIEIENIPTNNTADMTVTEEYKHFLENPVKIFKEHQLQEKETSKNSVSLQEIGKNKYECATQNLENTDRIFDIVKKQIIEKEKEQYKDTNEMSE